MPRHKYSSTGKPSIDINALVAAIKEVTIEKKTLRSVGRAYNIGFTKLSRYISKLKMANVDTATASNKKLVDFVSTLTSKTGGKTVFTAEQENELIKYVRKASAIYYGLSIKELRTLAYEFAKKIGIQYPAVWDNNGEASKDWYYAFMHRHQNLCLRTPEQISANRAKTFSEASVNPFFASLHTAMFQQGITFSKAMETMIMTSPENVASLHRKAEEKRGKEAKTEQKKKEKAVEALIENNALSTQTKMISNSSESEEKDFCIICKGPMPKKLNRNNSIHCNTCDRAVHLKCAQLTAGFYTYTHCESD